MLRAKQLSIYLDSLACGGTGCEKFASEVGDLGSGREYQPTFFFTHAAGEIGLLAWWDARSTNGGFVWATCRIRLDEQHHDLADHLPQNSQETARKRGSGRPFSKGVSGNPGGRPREIGHVRELAQRHTEEAIDVLVTLMREGRTDTARAAAASELLSRGWGKPALPLQHENARPPIITSKEDAFRLEEVLRVAARTRSTATSDNF